MISPSRNRCRAIAVGVLLPAIFLLLGARQQTHEEFQAAFKRGLTAYRQGDFTAAIESFEAALSAQPDNVQARFNLARSLRQAQKAERALEELLKLEGRMKDRSRYVFTLGQIYADLGRLAEAQEALSEAAELRPKVAQTQYWLGEVLAAKGEYLEAIEKMELAAKLLRRWYLPLERLGEIWLRPGASGQAIDSLERAAELAPEAHLVLVSLGEAYVQAGRHEDAARVLEKALEMRPEMARGRALLANSLLASGKAESAANEYRRAVEQDPENTRLRSGLALALHSNQQFEEAVQELEQVLAQEPQNGLVLYYLGIIAAERRQKRLARERLEAAVAALESQPGTMEVRAGRGGESYPLRIAAQVKLAELLSQSREQEAAAKLLEAVVQAEPDHATARYLLGIAYRRLGNREEARRELNLFKQINDAREHDQLASARG